MKGEKSKRKYGLNHVKHRLEGIKIVNKSMNRNTRVKKDRMEEKEITMEEKEITME